MKGISLLALLPLLAAGERGASRCGAQRAHPVGATRARG
jgi:hypothetical protein